MPDEHFGLLLHPLFAHAHGDAHPSTTVAVSATDEFEPLGMRSVDQAPGISASTSSSAAHDAIAGLLLPLALAGILAEAARRIAMSDVRPEQRALAPPNPPPRLVPSVA